MLVIYQESLHDAWSTKYKIRLAKNSEQLCSTTYMNIVITPGDKRKGSICLLLTTENL